jgi:hypothetical protein
LAYSSASTALADPHRSGSSSRSAVAGHDAIRKNDRAVLGPVGVAAFDERRDELDDLRDVLGRAGHDVGRVSCPALGVGEERARPASASSRVVTPRPRRRG